MKLCLDIGNSQMHGGIFKDDQLLFQFRYPSHHIGTSDQFGLFLKNVLRENNIDPTNVRQIAMCSVVPSLDYTINAACIKYFNITPFMLKAGIKTGINLRVKNPLEVGADRIANAIAATERFPNRNIIIVDFGTATTICVILANKSFVGGAIMPGIKMSMQALHQDTAKLPSVEIIKPIDVIGDSTETNLQIGLYYSQLGAISSLINEINKEHFRDDLPVVIASGGFAHLFGKEKLYDINIPDLVLQGLRLALEKNESKIPQPSA